MNPTTVPFLRVTLVAILAVVCRVFIFNATLPVILLAFVCVLALLFLDKLKRQYWSFAFTYLLTFCLVFVLCDHKIKQQERGDLLNPYSKVEIQKVRFGEKYARLWVKDLHSTNGMELYIPADSIKVDVFPGDLILVKNKFKPLVDNPIPGQFCYASYLARYGIYYQAFIQSGGDFQVVSSASFNLNKLAFKIASYLKRKYKKYGLDTHELGIASALIFGDKSELDRKIQGNFSTAGVMHVLAVSGLHLGIVYLIAVVLLRLKNKNTFSYYKLAMLLAVIWTYALVTGFSPSVQRAAVMFSFLAVSKKIARQASIYNVLAAAALVLIINNPLIIFEIGFQMSFTAILGILLLYPHISALITWRFKPWRFIWDLMAVSIAAQISTGILALFYFGQFPTYFLLANLVAIPLVTLLVWVGAICNISFLIFPWLSGVLVSGIGFLVELLNEFVSFVAGLPHASMVTHSFGIYELVFSLVGLIFLTASCYGSKALYRWGWRLCLLAMFIPISSEKATWAILKSGRDLIVASPKYGWVWKSNSETKIGDYQKSLSILGLDDFKVYQHPGFVDLALLNNRISVFNAQNIYVPRKDKKPETIILTEPIWDVGCLNEIDPKTMFLGPGLGAGYADWLYKQGLNFDIDLQHKERQGFFVQL
ncbi:ComEC/Rec2 family competence protein [Luteibaculum oceani]|uniref:ComEC family competence protein n=1 Tax=Luteibaculum oceani TaxID=1294296 RepID=A0A5C6V8J6_9FLAO|nr:ComEC/Rec2 family competence protein [Luteibaculum oceani]TXC81337.1 ComEC family competence protein [Luteibaculum oceani]